MCVSTYMNPNTMYKEFQRLADSDSTTEWTSYDWFKAGCTYSNENVNIMQEKKVRHKKTLKLTRVDGYPIIESTD